MVSSPRAAWSISRRLTGRGNSATRKSASCSSRSCRDTAGRRSSSPSLSTASRSCRFSFLLSTRNNMATDAARRHRTAHYFMDMAMDSKLDYSMVQTDNSAGNFVKIQQRIPVRIDLTDVMSADLNCRMAACMYSRPGKFRVCTTTVKKTVWNMLAK